MFDDAMNELRYARRTWETTRRSTRPLRGPISSSHVVEKGMARFQLVRGYQHHAPRLSAGSLTAEGELLPHDVDGDGPVAYWDLIRSCPAQNGLDPYLVGALVLQESTYVADIRSHANAYGLMQLLPSTARQYARKLGIPYSTRVLTDPELNIRMGTAYFSDKIMGVWWRASRAGELQRRRTGRAHLDGGAARHRSGRVHRRHPVSGDAGYVRKILGMADDYRRLYGSVDASKNGLDSTPGDALPSLLAPPAVAPTPCGEGASAHPEAGREGAGGKPAAPARRNDTFAG